MKTKTSRTTLDNKKFNNLELNTWALHSIKGGCDDDSDCEDEQTAVVLDNGSGG